MLSVYSRGLWVPAKGGAEPGNDVFAWERGNDAFSSIGDVQSPKFGGLINFRYSFSKNLAMIATLGIFVV
jgi:hypothetical protein